MKKAFLFPGQGSQFIGMGQELANQFEAARDVFSEVDDALGENLSSLMFQGRYKRAYSYQECSTCNYGSLNCGIKSVVCQWLRD